MSQVNLNFIRKNVNELKIIEFSDNLFLRIENKKTNFLCCVGAIHILLNMKINV